MVAEVAVATIFSYVLVFCRLGAALSFMPGFGEVYIAMRARLVMALVLSAVVTPMVQDTLPPIPEDVLMLALLMLFEITVGVFMGMLMRVIQGTVHIAGMIIAFQSSLASALLFDATQGNQGSVIGNLMTVTATTLVFVTDLHHLMLAGVVNSFDAFQFLDGYPTQGFMEIMARTLSDGFVVAFKMAAPLIAIGLCVYLAGGLMGRLMPSMQVFFVIVPIQIYIGFFVVAATLTAAMMMYLQYYEEVISIFIE